MRAVLAQIDGYDPGAGAPVSLFVSNVDDAAVCMLNGTTWWPTISKLGTLKYDLFDGSFAGSITSPSSSLALQTAPWPNFGRYSFADARIRLWTGDVGAAWGSYTLRFDGRLTAQPTLLDGAASIAFATDDKWLDRPLLSLYAGTTGIEGPGALKGTAKPLALGAPRYVAGVLIDSVNSVFQVSAYGTIQAIDVAFERLVRFGAAVGDYPTYAALVAASIPAGRWATCLARGLARFGAPTTGQICFHVQGDTSGSDGWARKPGQLIRYIAKMAGGADKIDEVSLNALDAARPYNLSIYLTEQTTARTLIQQIAASVNAVAIPTWLGKLAVVPIPAPGGTAAVTLAADGSSLPPVTAVQQLDVAAPFSSISLTAERTYTVHQLADIAFTATLIDLGPYVADTTYREGNIVQDQGASWLYINPTPSAGNAPPTLPSTSSPYWKALSNPGNATFAQDDPPRAAESKAYDTWVDTNDGNKAYRRLPGSGLLSIGGHRLRFTGHALELRPWVEMTDTRLPAVTEDLKAVQAQVVALGSDAVLSSGSDKRQVRVDWAALSDNYAALNAKYIALGSPADLTPVRSGAVTAYNALGAYLDSLSPAWDDLTVDTGVAPATWQTKWTDAYAAISAFGVGISGRPGIVPRGAYDPTTTYFLNNSVTFGGGSYIAVRDNFSGHAPSGTSQATAYWDVLAAPGDSGAPSTPPSSFSATIDLAAGAAVNLRAAADAAGYTGHSDATITFRVPAGVTIRGLGGGGIGIDTGTWPGGYTIALTLQVSGTVDGGGGDGGNASGGDGGAGGDAIFVRAALSGGITVNAGGVVRAGGGGGGAGSSLTGKLGAGGGGGGAPNGAGGAGSDGWQTDGVDGNPGTTSGGGTGGSNGATGGTFGAAGSASAAAAGGAAGYAVRKNGFTAAVTNNGTMTGSAT